MEQLHQPSHTHHSAVPLDSPYSEKPEPTRGGHVDVKAAKDAFFALEVTAANSYEGSESSQNEKEKGRNTKDDNIEKGDPDRFDLKDYLHSSNSANEEAGIAHKHVGVTWQQLGVVVPGGSEQKVGRSCVAAATFY